MRRIVLDLQGGLFGRGSHAGACGIRSGLHRLSLFKTGGYACALPKLSCQCAGDGGHPTGHLEAERADQTLQRGKNLGWDCKVLLLVDENADEQLAAEVRQTVKDQLADDFIYASVSPTYLAGVIDIL